MKQILLVEPHGDDICLSLFHFLKRVKADYFLMTVNWSNEQNSKMFCDKMGIRYYPTKSIENVGNYQNRISPHIIRKKKDAFLYERHYYLEHHTEAFVEIKETIEHVATAVSADMIITTLGLLHPFHVLTSVACSAISEDHGRGLVFFADFPYASRKYGEKIIEDFHIEAFHFYDKALKNEKIKMFEKCYPSEKGILRWDRSFVQNHFEMLFPFKGALNESGSVFSWR